jgi:uncharacterized protein
MQEQIVRGASGTVAGKQEALRNAGITVLESPIHVAEWARKYKDSYNVYAIVLFGSYAQGTARDYRDIDLAVFSDDFGKDPFMEMKGLLKLRRQVNPDIEPLPFSKQIFFDHDKAEFVSEIHLVGLKSVAAVKNDFTA